MKFTVAQGLVVVALMMTATPSRARAASPLSTIEQDLKVAQEKATLVEEKIVEPAAGDLEDAYDKPMRYDCGDPNCFMHQPRNPAMPEDVCGCPEHFHFDLEGSVLSVQEHCDALFRQPPGGFDGLPAGDQSAWFVRDCDVILNCNSEHTHCKDVPSHPPPREGYLEIIVDYNLGLNNIRGTMMNGIHLAKLLHRTLIVAPFLHMRDGCPSADAERCTAIGCFTYARDWWCPVEIFFSIRALTRHGAAIVIAAVDGPQYEHRNDHAIEAFRTGKTRATVNPDFFELKHLVEGEEGVVWIDQLPSGWSSGELPPEGASWDDVCYDELRSCEMFGQCVRKCNIPTQATGNTRVFGFVEEYGRMTQDIVSIVVKDRRELLEESTGMVVKSHSIKALQEAKVAWNDAVQYSSEAISIARDVRKQLVERSDSGTYMCAHLRRGDFATLKWNQNSKDADVVTLQKTLARARLFGEIVYLATDEKDPTMVKKLQELNIHTEALWYDDEVAKRIHGAAIFDDFRGVVEQIVCGTARRFYGSRCSSFTGGILRIRELLLPSSNYYRYTSNKVVVAKDSKGFCVG